MSVDLRALLAKGTPDDFGSVQTVHEEDGKLILGKVSDIEPLLKANAEQRAMSSRVQKKGDLHHVMRIDQDVLEAVCTKHGLNFFDSDDAKKVLQILKGPEFSVFRVYDGDIL